MGNIALGKRIVSTEPPPVAEPEAVPCTGLFDVAGIIDIVVTAAPVEEVLDVPPVNVAKPSVIEIILENQPDELVFPEALEVLFKAEVTGVSAVVLGVELFEYEVK